MRNEGDESEQAQEYVIERHRSRNTTGHAQFNKQYRVFCPIVKTDDQPLSWQ